MSNSFDGRVGFQQRVLPDYRADFFEGLGKACLNGLSVFAGDPLPGEGIHPIHQLKSAQLVHAHNHSFFNPGSRAFLCWQGGFIQWLEDWQPDVLIVEANPRYLSTRSAIRWMHARKRKVIGWGLGAPAINGPLENIRRWERAGFLRSLDAIVSYSQNGGQQYRQMGFASKQVYVAPNATSAAPGGNRPGKAIRAEEPLKVLFVGRIQARKRVDLLIKAWTGIPETLRPKLIIVGDGPARLELENLAQTLQVEAEFVGEKHRAEVEPYFDEADLFVLPGTGGLAIQQAMAHSLPIIVARGDGTQDDLVRAQNGWQVPPDDLKALTDTIALALADRVKLRQMGDESYRIVAEEINVEKMVEVFVRALNDVSR